MGRFLWLGVFLQFFQITCAIGASQSFIEPLMLSKVLRYGLTSLLLEPEQERKKKMEQARRYAWIRKKRRSFRGRILIEREVKQFFDECNKNPKFDLFCFLEDEVRVYQKKNLILKQKEKRAQKVHVRHAFLKKALKGILLGSFELLKGASEGEIRKALQKIRSFSQMEKCIDLVLSVERPFEFQSLAFLLAAKAEEFLPDEKIKKKVISLYEKSARNEESFFYLSAHFRVSLLYLWDGKCDLAMDHLKALENPVHSSLAQSMPFHFPAFSFQDDLVLNKNSKKQCRDLDFLPVRSSSLLDEEDVNTFHGMAPYQVDPGNSKALWVNEYASRAYYWKYQCLKQKNLQETKSFLSEQARVGLIEKYPFSLHALLVQAEDKSPIYLMNGFKEGTPIKLDSEILLKIEHHERMSDRIEAVEALLALNEKELAREIMTLLEEEIESVDPRFRLYVATLHMRMHDFISHFKLLSGIFKEDPGLVSKQSLGLLYPNAIFQENFQNSLLNSLGNSLTLDQHLLLSLIRQESAFDAKARSPVGAMGLMQVMPKTAKKLERFQASKKLYDPEVNVRIGSKYFNILLNRYDGDVSLSLAAYNAGVNRVDEWLVRYPVKNRILFLDLIPYKETRQYVSSIARNYFWYRFLYASEETCLKNLEAPCYSSVMYNLQKLFKLTMDGSL